MSVPTDGSTSACDEASWLQSAARLASDSHPSIEELLSAVDAGVKLRRVRDAESSGNAAGRAELIEALARLQQTALRQLRCEAGDAAASYVATRLRDDDEFLAQRLASDALATSAEAALRSLGGLRDDLHWTASVLAIAERRGSVSFGLRAAVEERRLWELLEQWLDAPHRDLDERTLRDLQEEGARLRKRLEGIRAAELAAEMAGRVEPQELTLAELRARWRSASELLTECIELITADHVIDAEEEQLRRHAERHRAEAAAAWSEAVAAADVQTAAREAILAQKELSQRAVDAAAFLEDSSYAGAVGGFSALAEDLDSVRRTMRRIASRADFAEDSLLGNTLHRARRAAGRSETTVRGQLQDCRLQLKLEATLGRQGARWFERMLLAAMLLFAAMMFASWRLDVAISREAAAARQADGATASAEQAIVRKLSAEHAAAAAVLAWCDLVVAAAFAMEFFFKLYLADDRLRYIRRYWLTGLVPALPIGFAAWAAESLTLYSADSVALLRFLRYLRLPQMVRWLRLLRPVVQSLRVAGLAFRAGDRLVAEFAPLINRNFVFFSRHDLRSKRSSAEQELRRLRDRHLHHVRSVAPAPGSPEAMRAVAARLWDLAAVRSGAGREQLGIAKTDAAREVPVEDVLAQLTTATSLDAAEVVEPRQARSLARWCRCFDLPLLRRAPIARRLAMAGRSTDDYEAVAAAARGVGEELEKAVAAVQWAADLYGTLTAPQLVDSTGSWLVERTKRPTIRLLLFGTLVLLAGSLAQVLPFDAVKSAARFFQGLLGWPLIVLGVLCLIPLVLGKWLQQIAVQAGEFFDQVAEAQFFSGARIRKAELAAGRRDDFLQRVLGPERNVLGSTESASAFDDLQQTVDELWNDYLHGAPFHASDAKTTNQLLGNLVLVDLRTRRLKRSKADEARLRQLSLTRQHALFRGPYVWFHFISRSVSQQIARMLVDYHRNATPLARRVDGTAGWRERNAAVSGAAASSDASLMSAENEGDSAHRCENDFTAMHFLAANDDLDARVERKYGKELLTLLRNDRRDNIRRVFRTYPAHRWPKDRRTWNPYLFYQRRLQGGRVLTAPFWLLGRAIGLVFSIVAWFVRQVRGLLSSATRGEIEAIHPDPFEVAERKILRMRRPVMWESMRMRAAFDPPYVGAPFPRTQEEVVATGDDREGERTTTSPIERDLESIGGRPRDFAWARTCGELLRSRLALLDRYRDELRLSKFSAEGLRAASLAFLVDYRGVRRMIENVQQLRDALEAAKASDSKARRRRRDADTVRRAAERCGFADGYDDAVFARAVRESSTLVDACEAIGELPTDPCETARRLLGEVAAAPESWTRQLVVLRAVQRLTAIDVAVYREFVYSLGEYDAAPNE